MRVLLSFGWPLLVPDVWGALHIGLPIDRLGLVLGGPVGSSLGTPPTPLGLPLGTLLGLLVGVPVGRLGLLLGVLVGSPLGTPGGRLGLVLGLPLGSLLGSPVGFPVGAPSSWIRISGSEVGIPPAKLGFPRW